MLCTVAIVTILCLAASVEDDAKAIRGEWRCTSLNLDGEPNGKELQRLTYRLLPGGIIRFDARGTY
jgi:hypothetical protein